ncbi:MAG: response regulator [Oscillospiraceae bacterium]|nr:response regulator [Oscillospiraceae bacterium]
MVIVEKFSVLVIDDDPEWCIKLIAHLGKCQQFDIMKPIHSGDAAIKHIELHRPDAIILDLLLPVNDGLYIIDYIDSRLPDYRPIIYVMSIFNTEKINRLLGSYDVVDYYSIKPVNPESATTALFNLLTSKSSDREHYVEKVEDVSPPAGLDLVVEDYLRKLGIGTATLQTKCVRVAIEILMQADKSSRIGMMELYRQTGQHFTPPLSTSAVDRHIRSAVFNIKKKRAPLFEAYFPVIGVTVNNGTFVRESANMLRRWLVESGNDIILSGQNSSMPRMNKGL